MSLRLAKDYAARALAQIRAAEPCIKNYGEYAGGKQKEKHLRLAQLYIRFARLCLVGLPPIFDADSGFMTTNGEPK